MKYIAHTIKSLKKMRQLLRLRCVVKDKINLLMNGLRIKIGQILMKIFLK